MDDVDGDPDENNCYKPCDVESSLVSTLLKYMISVFVRLSVRVLLLYEFTNITLDIQFRIEFPPMTTKTTIST